MYYAALKQPPPSHNILASTPRRTKTTDKGDKKQIHFFNIDNELVYWNFFLDFGPLNLGQLTRFSHKLNDKLRKFPVVCFYSNTVPAKRANAIFLICAWQLLYLDRTPLEAYRGFDLDLVAEQETGSEPPVSNSQGVVTIGPLPPFHDASPCQCTYDITVLDCLLGMSKARECGFFDFSTFDVEEYEYYEQVEVCICMYIICCCWGVLGVGVLLCCASAGPLYIFLVVVCGNTQQVTHLVIFSFLLFCTEWRLELDHQGQNLGLCRTVL